MVYPCCCGCKCIRCITVSIIGVDPVVAETWAVDAVDRTYNKTFTFWSRETTTRSPLDLFDNPGSVCIDASYPGTQCVLVADTCCQPDVEDDIPEGPVTDLSDPVPL